MRYICLVVSLRAVNIYVIIDDDNHEFFFLSSVFDDAADVVAMACTGFMHTIMKELWSLAKTHIMCCMHVDVAHPMVMNIVREITLKPVANLRL